MTDQAHLEPLADDGEAGRDERAERFRQMRARAREADRLGRRVEVLERELAFRDAGLDLTEDQRAAVMALRNDDQPLSADAVLELAERLAFVAPPQAPLEEQAAHARVQDAMTADAAEAYPESIEDRIAKARTPQEVEGILRNAGIPLHEQ